MSSDVHIDGRGDGPATFDAPDHVYEALAHPRQSVAIEVLRERGKPIAAADLAARIVAREDETSPADVADSEYRPVVVALRHRHLPSLRDHGLIDWRPAGDGVSIADELPIDSDRLAALLETRRDRECARLFETLADARRRHVISVLARRGEATLTTLSRTVAAREANADPEDVSQAAVDRLRISLHHSHLPAMSASGLLAYDGDASTIEYRGHPMLLS